ncbi:MAG TPA: 1,4-dihydroxy-2-naphthoate polyprenyltransferase [Bacteroidales bacterium]
MPKINSWIKAARLRTLPLALSSILAGSFMAIYVGAYSWKIIVMAAITTVLLQVLSNMANDYGDSQKGTDNQERVGPVRTVQGGEISPDQMKKGVILVSFLTLFSGIALLYVAFPEDFYLSLLFFIIGLAAIAAAIKYTIGSSAYGYKGLGDFFVLVFFGFVGVLGTYFLNTHELSIDAFLPALGLGLLSTGVLNLNNMRDMKNDIKSGKHTLASRLGFEKAKIYHTFLVIGGIVCLGAYIFIHFTSNFQLLFLVPIPILIKDLIIVLKAKDQSKLDPFLKKLAIGTLLTTIFFGISLLL